MTTHSFWAGSVTPRHHMRFKPRLIVFIEHKTFNDERSLPSHHDVFSTIVRLGITFAIYHNSDHNITLLMNDEAEIATLRLALA